MLTSVVKTALILAAILALLNARMRMKFVIRHLRHLLPLEGQESVWLPMATGLSHRAQRSPQKQVSPSRFVSNNRWQSMPTLVAQPRWTVRMVVSGLAGGSASDSACGNRTGICRANRRES